MPSEQALSPEAQRLLDVTNNWAAAYMAAIRPLCPPDQPKYSRSDADQHWIDSQVEGR
jgi:hypothetical protein